MLYLMKRCYVFLTAFVLAVMVFAASAGAFTYFDADYPDDWEAYENSDGSVTFESGNNWIYVAVVDMDGRDLYDITEDYSSKVINDYEPYIDEDDGHCSFSYYDTYGTMIVVDTYDHYGDGRIPEGSCYIFEFTYSSETIDALDVIAGSLDFGSSESEDDDDSGCNIGMSAFAVFASFLVFLKKSR